MKQLPRKFHHKATPNTTPQNYEEPSFRTTSQTSIDSDSDPEPSRSPAAGHPRPLPQPTPLSVEPVKSTDSEILSDDTVGGTRGGKGKKTVAIDTSQNEHFSHRLMPVRSPEFDNVIDQVHLCLVLYFTVRTCTQLTSERV